MVASTKRHQQQQQQQRNQGALTASIIWTAGAESRPAVFPHHHNAGAHCCAACSVQRLRTPKAQAQAQASASRLPVNSTSKQQPALPHHITAFHLFDRSIASPERCAIADSIPLPALHHKYRNGRQVPLCRGPRFWYTIATGFSCTQLQLTRPF